MVFSRTDVNETVTSPFTIQRFWLGGKKNIAKRERKERGTDREALDRKTQKFSPPSKKGSRGGVDWVARVYWAIK